MRLAYRPIGKGPIVPLFYSIHNSQAESNGLANKSNCPRGASYH